MSDGMYKERDQLIADFRVFFLLSITLVVIGILFIYSSSSVYAMEKLGDTLFYVKRQLSYVAIGLFLFLCARLVPPRLLRRFSGIIFLVSLLLTMATLWHRVGVSIHAASRWLRIGPLMFQPSEILKMSFVIYVASCLDKVGYRRDIRDFVYLLAIMFTAFSMLIHQPDFGQAVLVAALLFIMLFVSGKFFKQLVLSFLGTIPALVVLILLKPYRIKRILTYLNPWQDPQGAGFQIIQSMIAVGSGGILGTGISHSKQKFFYLPMHYTDFIFSIICEETGLIGAIILAGTYLLYAYYGFRIASYFDDLFSSLVVVGFSSLVSLQATINMAVAVGLLPTKGIGLPYVSYGGSSVVTLLAMLGVIASLVKSYR